MAKMVNFMLCIFYHNKNELKRVSWRELYLSCDLKDRIRGDPSGLPLVEPMGTASAEALC